MSKKTKFHSNVERDNVTFRACADFIVKNAASCFIDGKEGISI